MKERPILFSAPMVRALLAGTKTQTRRIVQITHRTPGLAAALMPADPAWIRPKVAATLSPYGHPGDRLWVKENYRFGRGYDGVRPNEITKTTQSIVRYEADGAAATVGGRPLILEQFIGNYRHDSLA